jgi:hypothetical protein
MIDEPVRIERGPVVVRSIRDAIDHVVDLARLMQQIPHPPGALVHAQTLRDSQEHHRHHDPTYGDREPGPPPGRGAPELGGSKASFDGAHPLSPVEATMKADGRLDAPANNGGQCPT